MLFGIAAEVGILLGLILLPPFQSVFGLAPLGFAEWWPLLFFPSAVLLLEAIKGWGASGVTAPQVV